nr:YqjK family protein [uncultured Undibacterium sp.]
MLSERQQQLQARRLILLARCQQQRQDLIWQSAQLQHELRFVELGLRTAQVLRASPVIVAAIAATLMIIKPRRVMWVLTTGLSSWRLWLKFAPMLMPLIPLLRRWRSGSQESQ